MGQASGIYKRGTFCWIRYSIEGQQFRESTKSTRKEEALRLFQKRQTEIFEGKYFPEKKKAGLTFEGLKNMWLEASIHKKSIHTDRQRFDTIVQYFKPYTPITSTGPEDLEKFRDYLKTKPTRVTKGMTPATINRHWALLRSAFKLASKRS